MAGSLVEAQAIEGHERSCSKDIWQFADLVVGVLKDGLVCCAFLGLGKQLGALQEYFGEETIFASILGFEAGKIATSGGVSWTKNDPTNFFLSATACGWAIAGCTQVLTGGANAAKEFSYTFGTMAVASAYGLLKAINGLVKLDRQKRTYAKEKHELVGAIIDSSVKLVAYTAAFIGTTVGLGVLTGAVSGQGCWVGAIGVALAGAWSIGKAIYDKKYASHAGQEADARNVGMPAPMNDQLVVRSRNCFPLSGAKSKTQVGLGIFDSIVGLAKDVTVFLAFLGLSKHADVGDINHVVTAVKYAEIMKIFSSVGNEIPRGNFGFLLGSLGGLSTVFGCDQFLAGGANAAMLFSYTFLSAAITNLVAGCSAICKYAKLNREDNENYEIEKAELLGEAKVSLLKTASYAVAFAGTTVGLGALTVTEFPGVCLAAAICVLLPAIYDACVKPEGIIKVTAGKLLQTFGWCQPDPERIRLRDPVADAPDVTTNCLCCSPV